MYGIFRNYYYYYFFYDLVCVIYCLYNILERPFFKLLFVYKKVGAIDFGFYLYNNLFFFLRII